MDLTQLPVTLADIKQAADRLAPVAHRTPVLTSTTFNQLVGAEVFFKCENLQRIGAFKFRGAYNAISRLDDDQRARGVVAYSSGNHAQAVALAASLFAIPATIAMPSDAPTIKRQATEGYGARVVEYDRYTQEREDVANEIVASTGATLIPPFNHPDIIAGQGSAAYELIEQAGPLDVVIAPLGGGGLLSGTAIATRSLLPDADVYGVEPQAGDDGQQSLRAGHIVTIPTPRTIADGAQTTSLGELTFTIIQSLVADILTASDEQLVDTMRFFLERMKIMVEPTGCLAAAALLHQSLDVRGKRVGVIISGGNIDVARLSELLGTPEGQR